MVEKVNIFVFGSNLAGRHGAGSAKEALLKHGAIYGKGLGLQGRSYAIPTKGHNLEILPLDLIDKYVDMFIHYAAGMTMWNFNVVEIGCGLAGYKPEQIAPMFKYKTSNVILSPRFEEILATAK
jgi:hypothetical protein